MDVTIDTSAWIAAIDSGRFPRLLAHVARAGARLVVPCAAYMEVLAQPDAERAWTRVQSLAGRGAREHLPPIVLSWGVRTLMERERKRAGIARTPCVERLADGEPLKLEMSHDEFVATHPARARKSDSHLRKEHLVTLHRSAADRFVAQAGGGDAQGWLATIFECWPTWFFESSPILRSVARTQKARNRLRANPGRYRATLVWTASETLIALAAIWSAAPGRDRPAYLDASRGSSADALIAATAAYADTFITEDRAQRARLEFAARQFGLTVRCATLSDYLETAE